MKYPIVLIIALSLLTLGCGDSDDEANNASANNGSSNNGNNGESNNNGSSNNASTNNGSSNNGESNNASNNGVGAWILCRTENDAEADGVVDEVSTYLYDASFAQLKRVETRHPGQTILDYATIYTYQMDRVIREDTDRGFDSIIDAHVEREHDGQGLRALERSYSGAVLQYEKTFDNTGNVTVEHDDSDGNGIVDYVTTTTFLDRAAQKFTRQEVADNAGALQYVNAWEYDDEGRPSLYEFSLTDGVVVSRTTYTYEGNVTRSFADYDLDGDSDLTTTITVDADGTRLTEVRNAAGELELSSMVETDGQGSDVSEYDTDADGVADSRFVYYYQQDDCE